MVPVTPLLTAVAGTLHLVLYARRAQQERYKYNRRWLSNTNEEFLWTDLCLRKPRRLAWK